MKNFLEALRRFADRVREKSQSVLGGSPEEQLRTPFETLLSELDPILNRKITCVGEVALPNRLGQPDYAVDVNGNLAGYVELKAPGTGVDARAFRGHNRRQFERFKALPNLLYTDGNSWALYRDGERIGPVLFLSGDITTQGAKAVSKQDAKALLGHWRGNPRPFKAGMKAP